MLPEFGARIPYYENRMVVWSVEVTTEFIRLFREHPCLWKIKSKDYSNRNLRNSAYNELIEYCKKIGFATANRDFVTKKIQNLRGAFRKELKKVTQSRNKSGSSRDDVYKPNLWYFDLLLFTKDQELPAPSISNMDENSIESETSEQNVDITSPSAHATNITSPPHEHVDDDVTPPSNPAPVEDTILPKRGMKRKTSVIDTQIKFMNVCTEAIKRREMTEFDGFAISVAKKLEKMNSIQALYAETLIHSVLRKGILNQLTEPTDICDKQCNKTIRKRANTPRATASNSSIEVEATSPPPLSYTDRVDTQITHISECYSESILKDYYNTCNDLE